MAEKSEYFDEHIDAKVDGPIKEVNVHSVALAAAVEAQQPKLLSKGMIKLYGIMAIGYVREPTFFR